MPGIMHTLCILSMRQISHRKKYLHNNRMQNKKSILIMTEWFYPGYKAGGPIQACHNLAMLLKEEYDVYLYTTDRDMGSSTPYAKVAVNQWLFFSDNVKVFYASPDQLTWLKIAKQIQQVDPTYLYLNSMYSVYFTIYPLLMYRCRTIRSNIILSPRGMLKASALKFKSAKKKSFLKMLKLFNISNGIGFHATDEQEKSDIRKIFGKDSIIDLIHDVPPSPSSSISPLSKRSGELKLIFVGRIHPIKNLHFIIECLKSLTQKIDLTVVGPIENKSYYQYCQKLLKLLPQNISISFTGEVSNEKIKNYLSENHFMILPSLGENYGYSIIESFCAGRPVIITDKTPWHNLLEEKIGWDLPVNHHDEFVAALNQAAAMLQDEFTQWSASALDFAGRLSSTNNYKRQYAEMFS
jgi:glycosyltransferase involved in cell wall biosynthesis